MNITESSTDYISVTPTATDFHSNFENTGVFARHEFLQSKPWAAFPTIVILSLASFVGTMGNVLTLLAIALNKSVRNVESVFIVNLALSDLYVTTVADPMSITGKHCFSIIMGKSEYDLKMPQPIGAAPITKVMHVRNKNSNIQGRTPNVIM